MVIVEEEKVQQKCANLCCDFTLILTGHAATENTQSSYMSYQVNNIMAIPVIDNMEPCPAYAQIHMHIYDLEDSHGQVP